MSISRLESGAHAPVMVSEVIEALRIRPEGYYCDGTFGRGGHSREILSHLAPQGRLLMMDRDPEAIAVARQQWGEDPRVSLIQAPFSHLPEIVKERAIAGIDGLLLDLGVSSPQLDQPERGFSFNQEGPLDMRMDPDQGESAAAWLARADERAIATVLWEYGEERHSRRIARAIVRTRQQQPLTTTRQLAELVRQVVPGKQQKHPATRTFQAIRIHINQELEELQRLLDGVVTLLAPAARLVVISFHSLEDRLVKRFIRRHTTAESLLPPDLPLRGEVKPGLLRPIGKARFPSPAELEQNPRARSAVVRVAERTPVVGA